VICSAVTPHWRTVGRPGYFGKRRDQITLNYDRVYGIGKWRLAWIVGSKAFTFAEACKQFYEESYLRYLKDRPDDVAFICAFVDVIDNSAVDVHSGCDYEIQVDSATHLQDVAIRNVLQRLGVKFTGERTEHLIIRSDSPNGGQQFSPGRVPFYDPGLILRPLKCPTWAYVNSVEAFWQSNKYLQIIS
jgi:hypothetical protein